jgi:fibronectin-binding autotransporter adhesin
MAQNYTRQSSFADGDTITAALFNNEFNQVVNAFSYSASSDSSTGHKHDGTAGQGGNIPQIGDIDFLNKIVVDNTNNRWGFYVQVSSGTVEQLRIQDGAIVPVTDDDIDLGTSSLEFKDLFLDGTAHIDTLDVDVNATVAGTLGVTGATTLSSTLGVTGATTLSSTLGVTGAITGSSTLQATTITATTAFVPDASDGASLGTSALEFSDLFLADGAVINFGTDQDVSLTHVADTGLLLNSTMALQFNDASQYINAPSATVLDINATDEIELNATLVDVNANLDVSGTVTATGTSVFASLDISGDIDVDGTTNLDVVDIDGAVNIAAATTIATDNKIQFRDTAIYVNSSTDGQLDIVADTEVQIAATTVDINGAVDISGNLDVGGNLVVTGTTTFNGGTLTMGDAATDNVVFGADINSNIIPNTDDTYDLGSSSQEWRNLYIDGTANIDSLVADTADINGGTIDGATIATSDITVGSGKTLNVSAGTLTLADDQISGDKVEGGTIAATTITTLTSTTGNITSVNATTVDTTNLEVTTLKAKDGTAAGSIADSTGVVTLASSVLTTTDINGGTVDGVTIGGSSAGDITYANLSDGTITITAFADEDDMSSDSATLVPTQQSVKAYVDSQVGTVDTLSEILANGNTTGSTDIAVDSAQKVQFRDAAIYLNSSVDGQLDIVADTEIQIAATTVDLNGNLDVSGTALVTGVLTTTAATVFNGGFASNAASTITTADNLDTLSLISTDADASVGPNLRLYRNSGSPADSDALGRINAVGRNDASQDVIYSTIETYALDVSDGTESAVLNFNVMQAGTSVSFFKGNNTEVVVNDDSRDLDFRVESDGNANMLFVDGGNDRVGIGRVPSISNSKLEVGGADNVSLINVEASGNTGGMGIGSTGLQLFHGASSKVLIGSGGMVVNEASADYDFRVESNGNANMLFVDGGADLVGIGTGSPIALDGNAAPGLTISSNGPFICLQDANNADKVNYISNNTGVMQFGIVGDNGASGKTEVANFSSVGAIFNDGGLAANDFRVESDSNANMLFVDAGNNRVGIATGSPGSALQVGDATYNDGTITVVDSIGFNSSSNLNPSLNRWALRARAGGV